MASKNSHNAAFVTGAVLGGLAGAAAALWKTPYSGEELRTKITGGGSDDQPASETVATGRLPAPSLKDKVLSTTEDLLAPVVGVKLGKTANDSGPDTPLDTTRTQPTTTGARATGEPPAEVEGMAPGVPAPETGGKSNVTPVDDEAAVPDRVSAGSPAPESEAATVEDLTTPQTQEVPDALKHVSHEKQPFPKLGGNEPGV